MRYEKALELLVGVLLAAGSACVGIGVYEASSNRSAALWWALASVSFLAAVLVPAVWLGVHPLFVWGRRKTAQWRADTAAVTPTPALALAPTSLPEDPTAIDVLFAIYMSPNVATDVSEAVRGLRSGDGRRLFFTADNGSLGGDPEYGTAKKLVLAYRFGGNTKIVMFDEHQQVDLP